MPNPCFIFTADNHLRPRTWSKHPTLAGDAYISFLQIVDFSIAQKLPIVQLGDLFDSEHPDSETVGMYMYQIQRLENNLIRLYYIRGNHDDTVPAWPGLSEWAVAIDGPTRINGIDVYGFDYQNTEALADRLAKLPVNASVVLTHQSWAEIQRVGHVDGSFSMLPRGVVMLTGDYHICNRYEGLAANGETVVAYSPGSTAMQALNEPPAKYFGVLYDDLSVTWHQLQTRPFISCVCRTDADMQVLLNEIIPTQAYNRGLPDGIAKPILQVKYDDSIPEAYNRMLAVVGDRYHFFPEPQHATTTQIIDTESLNGEVFDNLESAIGLCCQDQAVYADLMRLYRSQAPAAEIDKMFKEFKNAHAKTEGVAV